MTCPTCKQPNAPDRNYCGGCGAPLAHYCALCGFRNVAADRFCGGCGSSLGAAAGDASTALRPAATSSAAADPAADSDLAELLAAAREPQATRPEDLSARVSQDDIDSLFGD